MFRIRRRDARAVAHANGAGCTALMLWSRSAASSSSVTSAAGCCAATAVRQSPTSGSPGSQRGHALASAAGPDHGSDRRPHASAALFRLLGQPPVIGEVVAGILLGPSLLGRVAPGGLGLPAAAGGRAVSRRARAARRHRLHVPRRSRAERRHASRALRTTVTTSHASIAVPFVLGAALALYLYPRLLDSGVPFTHFALFLGVAMSITAFPGAGAHPRRSAADADADRRPRPRPAPPIGDVTAWCLLAFAVGVVQRHRRTARYWSAS